MLDQPLIHPGVDTSGKLPARRRRRAEPPASTWWANRFLEAVEAAAGKGRLARGLEYARRGRVDELAVEPGHASAQVQGSRPTPYRVALRLAAFDDALWARAIARMGGDAATTADLVAGVLPASAEEAFAGAGGSLFPSPEERVAAACTCPDATRPCKHAAALIYVLAGRFDKDPFVVFALRGRGREEVLAGLRVARKQAASRGRDGAPGPAAAAVASEAVDLPADPDAFWTETPAELGQSPTGEPGDTLKRLGLPPRALGGAELKMELALAYRFLAERARRVTTHG